MGLPNISVIFKGKAESMMQRGERGIVALLLKDVEERVYTINSITDIPESLSKDNEGYIKDALKGNDTIPRKIYAVTYTEDLLERLKVLTAYKFQYLAIPGIEEEEVSDVSSWVKEQVDNKNKTFQVVLPNSEGGHEGVINLTTDEIVLENEDEPTTSEFTARIAGLLAGTPLTKSATYAVLDDVVSVEVLDDDEANDRIDDGEFILINSNDEVKVARAVTSLTETGDDKTSEWKKILLVQKMFMWEDDVKSTIKENYVGKYTNNYNNKRLLITDIKLYNRQLAREGILDDSLPEYNDVDINIETQKDFLEGQGMDVDNMKEDEIKKANTKDKVFIVSNPKFTDAMEDFEIVANI